MNAKELANRLIDLGLNPTEAEAYVRLTMAGKSKASDLSKTLDVGRTDTYRTLKRLVARGFATETLDKPTEFEAQPPERVFDRILEEFRDQAAGVERVRAEVSPALRALRTEAEGPAPGSLFQTIKGRPDILAALRDLLLRAEHSIDIIRIAGEKAVQLQPAILSVLLERAADGLAVRCVAEPSAAMEVQAAAHPEIRFRFWDSARPIFVATRDQAETMMLLDLDPRGSATARNDIALHTNAPGYMAAQLLLFDLLWENGEEPTGGGSR